MCDVCGDFPKLDGTYNILLRSGRSYPRFRIHRIKRDAVNTPYAFVGDCAANGGPNAAGLIEIFTVAIDAISDVVP